MSAPTLIIQEEEPESELARLDRSIERFLVVIITIVGGGLRFAYLGRPTISLDEAALWTRLNISFDSFLISLKQSASPLFDLIYWALVHFLPPHLSTQPYIFRALSAVAGTLLVPAVYLLAKQLVSIRGAVLAGALTAASALALGFSREAMFDAPLALFIVLNLTALLAFLRERSIWLFIGWIVTGLVMTGLHFSAVLVLPVEILVLLTFYPPKNPARHWSARFLLQMVVFVCVLAGLAIIASPILLPRAIDRIATQPTTAPAARTAATQPTTQPAPPWHQKLSQTPPMDLATQTAGANLMGWEAMRGDSTGTVPYEGWWYLSLGFEILLALFVLTLLPWPRAKVTPLRPRRPWEVADAPSVSYRYQHEIPNHARLREPVWRIALYLLALIVLPAFFSYASAHPDLPSPDKIRNESERLAQQYWPWTFLAVGLIAVYLFFWIRRNHPVTRKVVRRDVVPLAQVIGAVLVLVLLLVAIAKVISLIEIPAAFVPTSPLFVFPAFAILFASLLFRIRWDRMRRVGIFVLLGINIAVACFGVFKDPHPRFDLVARDITDADLANSSIATYVNQPNPVPTPDYLETMELNTHFYLARDNDRAIVINSAQPGRGKLDPLQVHRANSERSAAFAAFRNMKTEEFILWDCVENPTPSRDGAIADTKLWHQELEQQFVVYDRWTWQKRYTLRRRFFLKPFSRAEQSMPKQLDPKNPDEKKILDALEQLQEQLEGGTEAQPKKPATRPPVKPLPRRPTSHG